MKKRVYSKYMKPELRIIDSSVEYDLCGGPSLPYGGDDGPGIAESKERDNSIDEEEQQEVQTSWGSLW